MALPPGRVLGIALLAKAQCALREHREVNIASIPIVLMDRFSTRVIRSASVWGLAASTLVAPPWLGADQPIAYSHKIHIDRGLQCLDCHSNADSGAQATIPSVNKCMLCHAKIAVDKPEIKKLAAYASAKREIPWQRVYGFDPGALVKFQHAPHIRAKVACARCHGDMTQAAAAQLSVKHTMGTCLSCHRENHAPEDCAACHY